jgi:hypothetical protein
VLQPRTAMYVLLKRGKSMSQRFKMLVLRFWRWLHTFSARRVTRLFLEVYGQDLKCPHCGTWISQMPRFGYTTGLTEDDHDFLKCGQCSYRSRWVNHGIVAFCVNVDGSLIEDKEEAR